VVKELVCVFQKVFLHTGRYPPSTYASCSDVNTELVRQPNCIMRDNNQSLELPLDIGSVAKTAAQATTCAAIQRPTRCQLPLHSLLHSPLALAQHSRNSPPVPMQCVLLQYSAAPALHPRRHSRLPLRRPYAANTLHKLSPAPCYMPLCPGMPQHSCLYPACAPASRPPCATTNAAFNSSHTPPLRRHCAACRPSHYATITLHPPPTHMP
jgi:hypothetical protein